jgi:DNA-binding NarL/FixJ family response regulator
MELTTVRIALADDQLLIRAGIRALLETIPGYWVEAEWADGHEAIAGIRMLQPDVVLLDIAMPGPSGIEVARTIRLLDCKTRILMVSSIERQEVIEQALSAGVDGYLLKDFVLAELQQALSMVLDGKRFLSPKIREMSLRSAAEDDSGKLTPLTARQTEILRHVASGRTTKEIARELGISPKTVEFHRSRLMDRTGLHDVAGLTRYAIQEGLVC